MRARTDILSRFLVTAQFLLCAILVLGGTVGVLSWPWLVPGVLMGMAVGLAGIGAIGASKVRIHPEPGENTELCTTGIYQWIRHPMYSGTLISMLFFAIGLYPLYDLTRWLAPLLWVALLAVLIVKLRREERLLTEKWPEYADYMTRTKRLIPGIY